MVKIQIRYLGEKRCEPVHVSSGAKFVTDAPKDNNGRGESFSPTDLLATALGTCMLTVMGIRADKEGWDISGFRAEVIKHMQAEPRKVSELQVQVHLPHSLAPVARATLQNVALNCPVKLSLHPDIKLPIEFLYF